MKDRLIKKFEDEIQALNHELKLELPKEIKRARELGDLRENAEYQAAKERQRLVESRISMLQKRVAEIAHDQRRSHPERSRRLRLDAARHRGHGEKLVFQLVMPEDADAEKGMISTTSPIGRAFLNKEPGDTVKVDDAGRHARVRDRQAVHHSRRSRRMMDRFDAGPSSASPIAEPYSPQRRTALVLTGTGTAGAYHAGVLRALHEAGVKLDIVAGRGVGVVGALFAAVDGAQRLWDDKGFWRTPAVRSLYGWRAVPRVLAWALAAAMVDRRRADRGGGGRPDRVSDRFRPEDGRRRRRGGLVGAYLHAAQTAFAPEALPTWLPRLVLLVLGAAGGAALVHGWLGRPRGRRAGLSGGGWPVRRCRRAARSIIAGA